MFNTQRDFDQLLYTIIEETLKIFSADRASLFLVDEEKKEVWSKIATGLHKGQVIRMEKSKGIVGHVISTGVALNIPNAYSDARFNPEIDRITGYETRNILCFPLNTFRGKTIGAFQVLNKTGGPFTKEDEQILSVMASQACVAIENVQAYEETVRKHETLSEQNKDLKKQLKGKYAYPTIVGDSPPIQEVKRAIDKVASTNSNVLVTGESGTGKELIARAIHAMSPRSEKPFVAINCAALPETLLESELFGIEKGVATGVTKRLGYFEQANHGTLFLDEVGEMSLGMQAKLLRALQEHSFIRVGGTEEVHVSVRVIGATNMDLIRSIHAGLFRDDLYYRLNVFPIHVPALRERGDDLPILARFILGNIVEKLGLQPKHFTERSLIEIQRYGWPGNVRELENMIERAVIMSDGEDVDMHSTVEGLLRSGSGERGINRHNLGEISEPGNPKYFDPDKLDMKQAVQTLETEMISLALKKTKGNQLKAAEV
ncbi:MAG: sigma 54-interacting transcriptional regulator, partial [Candidatus Nomurabacteria bacterium]|nr:sigma 54-interacting transcriptional regulator [Candidatus Nomurabacteria bacterium]